MDAFQIERGSDLVLFRNESSPFVSAGFQRLPVLVPAQGAGCSGAAGALSRCLQGSCRCRDVPRCVVRGKRLLAEAKEEAPFYWVFEPSFFSFSRNVSPKSLDWIGQNRGFRISAHDGFRISSKHVLLCLHCI